MGQTYGAGRDRRSACAVTVVWPCTRAASGPFLYVTNGGAFTVSVFSTATNTLSATVSVGANPWSVAVNPAGTVAYVVNNSGNSVSVISTATNKVTATIGVGIFPQGVAVSPNGSTVYVTNFDSASVSVISASTNTVTGLSRPYPQALSPDGAFDYVAVSTGIAVISTSTRKVTATLTGLTTPQGVALGPA